MLHHHILRHPLLSPHCSLYSLASLPPHNSLFLFHTLAVLSSPLPPPHGLQAIRSRTASLPIRSPFFPYSRCLLPVPFVPQGQTCNSPIPPASLLFSGLPLSLPATRLRLRGTALSSFVSSQPTSRAPFGVKQTRLSQPSSRPPTFAPDRRLRCRPASAQTKSAFVLSPARATPSSNSHRAWLPISYSSRRHHLRHGFLIPTY